jgi:hypothetical protein
MDELICRSCQHPVDVGDLICPGCNANLTAPRAVVAAGAPEPVPTGAPQDDGPRAPVTAGAPDPVAGAPDASCANCGEPLPAEATVCVRCMRPVGAAVTVTLERPSWRYVVRVGATLMLGRDPERSPAAAALAEHDKVSRRHARVAIDAGGAVVVTDLYSTNGTFVDGERLPAGGEGRIPTGSSLRLASTATFQISASAPG